MTLSHYLQAALGYFFRNSVFHVSPVESVGKIEDNDI